MIKKALIVLCTFGLALPAYGAPDHCVMLPEKPTIVGDLSNIEYIWVPGNSESPRHATCYVKDPYQFALTKETFKSAYALPILLKNPHVPLMSEVEIRTPETKQSWTDTIFNLVGRFGAYLRDSHRGITHTPVQSGTVGTIYPHMLYRQSFVLGQEDDINIVKNEIKRVLQEYPNAKIVLCGASRGAATIINLMSQDFKNKDKIVAAIVEAPFDSIPSLLSTRFWWAEKIIGTNALQYGFSVLYPGFKHDSKAIHPINSVTNFPQNIPVLFVSSEVDETVPHAGTVKLFQELKNKKHQTAELITLKKSSHPFYIRDNQEDVINYIKSVHEFYKKHQLPYMEQLTNEQELKKLTAYLEPSYLNRLWQGIKRLGFASGTGYLVYKAYLKYKK